MEFIKHYPFKNKQELIEYQKENPDFIIPLSFDMIGRNILKENKQALIVIINNVLKKNFKVEDIDIQDGRVKKETLKEKQREADVFVSIEKNKINVEINRKENITDTMNQKNMTYLADLIKNFGEEMICQINLNTFDAFGQEEKIYKSQIKNEEGEVRIKNFIIYDVTLPLFKNICYTDSELKEDFLKLMKMFSCDSKKEIEKIIKGNDLLEEVYRMQKKLNSDEFILEHFPDELYHELEKKEFLEKGREEGKIETTLELAKKMINKKMDLSEISDITGFSLEELNKIVNEK